MAPRLGTRGTSFSDAGLDALFVILEDILPVGPLQLDKVLARHTVNYEN